MNRLSRGGQLAVGILIGGRVVVAVVVRKIGAGDVEADAMADEKAMGGGPQADAKFGDLAGRKQLRLVEAAAIPSADHSGGDVDRLAALGNVDEAGEKVGVGATPRGE